MLDVARRNDRVDALCDAILKASAGIACAVSSSRSVIEPSCVVDDRDLLGEIVAALHVSGKDGSVGAEKRIGSANVLVQIAALREY